MRIAVNQLELGSAFRTALDEHIVSNSDEVGFETPVVGELEVTRTGHGVLVKGRAKTITTLVCGRCLESFQYQLEAAFREDFALAPDADVPSKGSVDVSDAAEAVGPGGELDVGELIRELLLLAVPMVPLCTPTCRGLCPQCGANWNRMTCTCSQHTIDPRLAPLQQFKASPRSMPKDRP